MKKLLTLMIVALLTTACSKPQYEVSVVIVGKSASEKFAKGCVERSVEILNRIMPITLSTPTYQDSRQTCDKGVIKKEELKNLYHFCQDYTHAVKDPHIIKIAFVPNIINELEVLGASTQNKECIIPIKFITLHLPEELATIEHCSRVLIHEIGHAFGIHHGDDNTFQKDIMTYHDIDMRIPEAYLFSPETIHKVKQCIRRDSKLSRRIK